MTDTTQWEKELDLILGEAPPNTLKWQRSEEVKAFINNLLIDVAREERHQADERMKVFSQEVEKLLQAELWDVQDLDEVQAAENAVIEKLLKEVSTLLSKHLEKGE